MRVGKLSGRVGKALAFCIVVWVFATMGALPMQTTTPAYASNQRVMLDVPTVPVPTVSVPVPTLPPDPLDTPTPEATDTPTPEPADTPTPEVTPTSRAAPTPTHESSSKPTPVPTPTDDDSSDDTPTPIPTPTATTRPGVQPTSNAVPTPTATARSVTQPPPPVPTATPATSQSIPTAQPASSTLTPSVTNAASNASAITPTATPKSSTPTTQRDQGTMTALIITSGLSATTLLTAGVLIGVQARKKRKKAAALDQTSWTGQGGVEGAMQQAASSHLIDQNVMMSPAMQEILQQSPSLFVATDQPGQIDQQATEMLASHPVLNNQNSFMEFPTEFLPTNLQNNHDHDYDRDLKLISEYHTEPRIVSIPDDSGAISSFQTEPMITVVQNPSNSVNAFSNADGADTMQRENTASFMLIPQDIRTDPTLNAMKKQAQMGIFVLLDQEKSGKQSGHLKK